MAHTPILVPLTAPKPKAPGQAPKPPGRRFVALQPPPQQPPTGITPFSPEQVPLTPFEIANRGQIAPEARRLPPSFRGLAQPFVEAGQQARERAKAVPRILRGFVPQQFGGTAPVYSADELANMPAWKSGLIGLGAGLGPEASALPSLFEAGQAAQAVRRLPGAALRAAPQEIGQAVQRFGQDVGMARTVKPRALGMAAPTPKEPWQMTREERVAEVRRLRQENRQALATPLLSEGAIAPSQVGSMGPQQRARWEKNANIRMDVESRVRLLESDELIERARARAERVVAEQRDLSPWMWTRQAWGEKRLADKPSSLSHLTDKQFSAFEARRHAKSVGLAVRQGKPVPPEVLAEYPDLARAATTAQEAAGQTRLSAPIRLEVAISNRVLGQKQIIYTIQDDAGKRIGEVSLSISPDGIATVGDFRVNGGANALSIRGVREVQSQLVRLNPEIKGFAGERVSGARGAASPLTAGGHAEVLLPSQPAASRPAVAQGQAALPVTPAPVAARPPVGAKRVNPAILTKEIASQDGYVYHATNADRLQEIADSGELKTHKANYGTDQMAWPDGATEKRAYFSSKAGTVWQFAPEEGKPVVVRTKGGAGFGTESTGDIFSRQPVPATRLEYLGEDGNWYPVSSLSGKVAKQALPGTPPAASRAAPVAAAATETRVPARAVAETLPRELTGAKPRYGYGAKQFTLEFASDVDKAAYITAQAVKSKQDAAYLRFAMRATGLDEAGVRAMGGRVRESIKAKARTAEPGTLVVPASRAAAPPARVTAAAPTTAPAAVSPTAAPVAGGPPLAPPGGGPPSIPPAKPPVAAAAQEQVARWQAEVTARGGPKLPSGRVPGGPRAPEQPPRGPLKPPEPFRNVPPSKPPKAAGEMPPPPDPFRQLQAALEPQPEPLLDRVRTAIPNEFYDRNYALKGLERRSGVPARQLAQVVPGARGAAEDILRRNQIPILAKLGKDIEYLQQYMVLRRADDLLIRFPGTQLPGGFTGVGEVNAALKAVKQRVGDARFAAIEQAAKDLWRMNDELGLKALVKEGILSDEMYLAMKTTHPHYIPFRRADFVDTIHQSFTKPEANLSSTGIKRITETGSMRVLDKPLERLLGEMHKTQGVIFRNRAARGIVNALEAVQKETGEDLVRYIEPKRQMNIAERVTGERLPRLSKAEHSKVWETVSYYDGGVKHTVDIPAEYGIVAKGLEAEPDNVLLKIVRAINAPLRHGAITYNPFFIPVNMMRDAMAAAFREKLVPFGPDYFAGMWAAIRKNTAFSEAAKSGVMMSGIVENMKSPGGLLKVPRPQGALAVSNPLDVLLLVPRLINEANMAVERGVRIATFRKLRASGIEGLEAAVRSRDVTVDFAKAGNTMRIINQVIPFSNAAVQGQANILRTLKQHPKRSLAIGMALFVTPTILARVNNMRYETSDLIPDYEYTRNWVIQFGEGTRKDGTKFPIYVKIPKGEIAAMFTFIPEALFHMARKSEDRSAVELLLDAGKGITQVLSPVDPSLAPPIPLLHTGAGLATGVDPFTGAPIVPRREQNLLPEQQFGEDTSAAAVAIGQRMKVSPRLIDFAINDYLAGAGQSSNWLLSTGMESLGFTPEPFGGALADAAPAGAEKVSGVPGVKRFVGTRATQPERVGWDNFNTAIAESNREFARIPNMNRLGVRLGEAGDSINNVELTPAQRARYQSIYADIAIPGVEALLPKLSSLTDEQKRDAIRKALTKLRDQARAKMWPDVLRERQTAPPVTPSGTRPGAKTLPPGRRFIVVGAGK